MSRIPSTTDIHAAIYSNSFMVVGYTWPISGASNFSTSKNNIEIAHAEC